MDDANAVAGNKPCLRLNCLLLACGVSSILIAAGTLAVTLTVYRVRAPVMTMNAISLTDTATSSSTSSSLAVLTVVADVSVRNPNAASMRYAPTETSVFYRGQLVGCATGPPGTAPARRTVRMNVTVGLAVGDLLGQPGFLRDVVAGGAVEVATSTTVRGRVAVLGGAVRRQVALEMNCTASVAVADMAIREQSCRQRVWLQ